MVKGLGHCSSLANLYVWVCAGNRLLLQEDGAAEVAEAAQHVRPPAVAGESPVSEDPYGSVAVIAINAEVEHSNCWFLA